MLKNKKFSTKIYFGYSVLIIMLVVEGWLAIQGISNMNDKISDLKNNQFTPSIHALNGNINLIAWNRAILNHVIASDETQMKSMEKLIDENWQQINQRINNITEGTQLSEQGLIFINKLKDSLNKAPSLQNEIIRLSRLGEQDRARSLMRNDLRPVVDVLDETFTSFNQLQGKQFEKAIA